MDAKLYGLSNINCYRMFISNIRAMHHHQLILYITSIMLALYHRQRDIISKNVNMNLFRLLQIQAQVI